MQCLDVRGCADLTELPALPTMLETLDIGECQGLLRLPLPAPEKLRRFYFNGCASLKPRALAGFLEGIKKAAVEELDGSGTPAVTSLEEFP